MRLAHHLLRHRSGVYHFRLIVPQALRETIGLRVIKRSLGTRDAEAARLYAYALGAEYAQAFAHARQASGQMPDDDFLKRIPRFEIRGSLSQAPDAFHIVTNGTPEDNRSALRALGIMREVVAARRQPAHDAPAPAAVRRPLPAAQAADTWLASIRNDTARKTLSIKSTAVHGFAGHFGKDRLLHEADRTDVNAWVQALRSKGLESPTVVNKLSYLRGFFNWAKDAGCYPAFRDEDNPARGHVAFGAREKKRRRAHGFKVFTTEQVRQLFSPDALKRMSDGARWGAVIGLYTGARVSEVGQLALVDFTTEDGVPCLTITDEGEGQSVKNEASRRTIPIHPDLLAMGLMDRVEALRQHDEVRLFPRAKPGAVNGAGNWLSKAFTRHIEVVGIEKPAKGKYGFHSLRKTAIQTMKAARVPLEWRCAYVGHDLDEEHIEAYSGEYGPAQILAEIRKGLGWGLDVAATRAVLESTRRKSQAPSA